MGGIGIPWKGGIGPGGNPVTLLYIRVHVFL